MVYPDAKRGFLAHRIAGFPADEKCARKPCGRVGIVELLGLSDAEIYPMSSVPFSTDPKRLMERLSAARPRGLNEIYQRIFKGSMPELYADGEIGWETYHRSYVDTYLQRDIRDLAQVADEMPLLHFLDTGLADLKMITGSIPLRAC